MDEVEESDVGAELNGLLDQVPQGERVRFGEGVEVVHMCGSFLDQSLGFCGLCDYSIIRFLKKSICKNKQIFCFVSVPFTIRKRPPEGGLFLLVFECFGHELLDFFHV